MSTTIFFASAVAMFLIGVPMGVAIGLAGIIYIFMAGIPEMIIIQRIFAGVDVAALMAIPFFILAGNLMLRGGLASRIIQLANASVGRIAGGLAIVTVIGCMFFAAISGSAVATAAAIGSVMIPAMVKSGYDRAYAGAVVATASPLGNIIPPSVLFILFGSMTSTSILELYWLGIPAGILMGLALIVVAYFTARKRGYVSGGQQFSFRELITSFRNAFWALGVAVIMIGGVFSGWFTPTESGVVAVVYAITIGLFVYRDLTWKDLREAFFESAKLTGTLMFIVANAGLFSYILTFERIPQKIVSGLLAVTNSEFLILALVTAVLLVAGTFMETIAIMLIMVPMFFPVIQAIGYDPVVFGVVLTVNLSIGMVTPPFGVCLYTTASVGGIRLDRLVMRALWPLGASIAVLCLYTFVPEILLFFK
jgi:C4-dicarboxylate transporter DctM subunit